MFPYDKEIEPGDRLMFTDEVEIHPQNLGIEHGLEYGDEMVVVTRDDSRHYPVCVTDPRDMTWQTWIYLTIAESARDFWLKTRELALDNEGTSSSLPREYYDREFQKLSPQERIKSGKN